MNAKDNPMQKIIAKCWEDEGFKKRLMAEPNHVLKYEGLEIPEGVTVNVLEDTASTVNLVLPCQSRLDDTSLMGITAGAGVGPANLCTSGDFSGPTNK